MCTLLDKDERREVDIDITYNGITIPDEFSWEKTDKVKELQGIF